MGCVARTARRRRKQAANNYRHMSKMRRPHYPSRVTAEASIRREIRYREGQKKVAGRRRKK